MGGRLPWRQLFRPAIELSRNGFTVGQALVDGMTGKENFYAEFPKFKYVNHTSSNSYYV